MMSVRAAFALAVALALGADARAGQPLLPSGSYAVTFRLELPHLERWAIEQTRTICVTEATAPGDLPLPVLSGGNPFGTCSAANLQRDGASLGYDIVCEGRDAARAKAAYTLEPAGFGGRISMVMGGKNMTMTEVQAGRRLGSCDLADTRQD